MPTISTGNPGWDQNLSTLGNALFPDPSKIGQAYYYGSEARKAQIEGAKLQDQLAAMHTATGMQFGRQPNPTYAPGPLGVTIMQDPYAAQGPQQTAPPSLSSIVGGGPPPAPTASGMPAGGMPPQVLPPAAPGQPVHPAAMASTLAATAATSSPTAIGNGIVAGVENHSMTGPGADRTGSDGSVPQNGPGQLHPASVTSAGGGGPTYAPPAAPDGSPAPISFNFGQSAALMAQAGLGADVIRTVLPATLGNMVKNGQVPVPEAETLAALFGVPNMRVQTLSNQGAAQVANIQGATQRATTAMTQAGETQRAGMPLQTIISPTDPTQVMRVPLGSPMLQNPAGTPSFNPDPGVLSAAVAPVNVQPGGAQTPVIQQPAFQAQRDKTPTYQTQENLPANEVQDYVEPKNPTQLLRGTLAQAQKNGWVRAPSTAEGWQALAASAAVNAKTPQEGQEIRNRVLTLGQTAVVKPDAANQDFQAQQILDQQLAKQFPVPTTGTVLGGSYTSGKNTEPAGASPALEITFKDLEDQYFRRGPGTVGDHVASANAALKQLLQERYINPEQNRSLSLTGEPTTISKGVMQKDGTVSQAPHFRVDLFDPNKIDPKTNKPMRADGILKVQMTPPMSSVMPPPPTTTPAGTPTAPAARAAAPFTTDIGPAPPGSPNGRTTSGGKPVEVRDGRVYR